LLKEILIRLQSQRRDIRITRRWKNDKKQTNREKT
jgi:hypothetical protein